MVSDVEAVVRVGRSLSVVAERVAPARGRWEVAELEHVRYVGWCGLAGGAILIILLALRGANFGNYSNLLESFRARHIKG